MTGIAERRFWPRGMPPREERQTAQKAICIAGIEREHVGALLHGSVCRDFLEPATACGVHHRLGLPIRCAVYDVSNACLGLLNRDGAGGQHDRAGADSGRRGRGHRKQPGTGRSDDPHLNADTSLSRNDIKAAFASLTIGSGSAAIVLCDRELSRTGNRLLGGVMQTATEHSSCAKAATRQQSPLSFWERGRG